MNALVLCNAAGDSKNTLVDRWQPLLFGCFLVIGCQKVQNRLFNGHETVE